MEWQIPLSGLRRRDPPAERGLNSEADSADLRCFVRVSLINRRFVSKTSPTLHSLRIKDNRARTSAQIGAKVMRADERRDKIWLTGQLIGLWRKKAERRDQCEVSSIQTVVSREDQLPHRFSIQRVKSRIGTRMAYEWKVKPWCAPGSRVLDAGRVLSSARVPSVFFFWFLSPFFFSRTSAPLHRSSLGNHRNAWLFRQATFVASLSSTWGIVIIIYYA